MVIDGRKIAEELLVELKKLPKPEKFLAVVMVGEDPASESFVGQKEKVARELGVDFRIYRFPVDASQDALRKEVLKITEHKTCGGVVVQLPLPAAVNKQYVLNAIPREKDVDVLGERALGAFYAGRNLVLPPAVGVLNEIIRRLFPLGTGRSSAPAAEAVLRSRPQDATGDQALASSESFRSETAAVLLKDKKVAVVGLGFLVGKPIATWLAGKCAEIFALDLGSDFNILKDADVVISGAGKAGILKPEMLKNDALVIDFGYSFVDGKISGDFDASSSSSLAYTPTPGGTGPILVAKLFENFYKLAIL
ncbi:MAG: bifunctional 5,10-methylenetetrahydrofolate dehydrogenase/5,10-methenyltetrahydrofolate cyclohydrolase [Candidatus Jorgensenbacteria bacterium]